MRRFTVGREGAIATIALDDGGMNLLSSAALRELHEAVDSLRDVNDARVVVFRSTHERIFAAGADMAEMQAFTSAEGAEFARWGQRAFAAIEKLPLVTVAMIDGDCFGGALDLVLAFDLRFATPRSRFSHPGGKLGIVTGFGGTSRWRKVLAPPAARRLFLGNPVLTAEEAGEAGLVDVVGHSFEDQVRRLLQTDPGTIRLLKELARGERLSRAELLRVARNHIGGAD